MTKYIVTASALRIRSGPGTTFAMIGMLSKNNLVQGDEIKGDWVHIPTTDNKIGSSHRGYLERVDESPPPSVQTAYRVDVSTLNVRQGAGTNYAVLGSLKKGEVVDGLSVSADNQWAQIRKASGAVTGWSSLKYLTKVTTPPPPVPTAIQMTVTTDNLDLRSGPGEGRAGASQRTGGISHGLVRLEMGQYQNS